MGGVDPDTGLPAYIMSEKQSQLLQFLIKQCANSYPEVKDYVASTTKERGLVSFKKCLLDGSISHLSFSILTKLDVENFTYGKYGTEYDTFLKPYIANLNNASGEIHCAKYKLKP